MTEAKADGVVSHQEGSQAGRSASLGAPGLGTPGAGDAVVVVRLLHSHSRLHMYADVLLGMTGRVERLMRGGHYALVSLNAGDAERRILGGARLVLHVEDLRVRKLP
ncbi:hypothetical protein HNP84_000348 [Thermocatellispora tengchongensis]|uniref:Ferrous iron transport protein A n=1 Tax=Thermocatellispora tengchongensis TaxID=1073253 RepID=A0A840NZR5_9ACTN|nr:hypothetical protein [Thermocatellispora tengchongensis]MBB5130660.1 hypothetical protein [Thermocatellispora tengchongensis]